MHNAFKNIIEILNIHI